MLARMVIGWLGFGTLKVCSRIRNRIRNKSLRIHNTAKLRSIHIGSVVNFATFMNLHNNEHIVSLFHINWSIRMIKPVAIQFTRSDTLHC